MKRKIIALMLCVLATNLAACGNASVETDKNTVQVNNENTESSESMNQSSDDSVASQFTEYYSDPDTGLEYKLYGSSELSDEYTQYDYVAKHVTYDGVYSGKGISSTGYYLKKDTFDDNYYKIFKERYCDIYTHSGTDNFYEWLSNETDKETNRSNFKLYKFVFDNETCSIQTEKKSLKIKDVEASSDTDSSDLNQYTDEQLERYEKYNNQSDEEFIEDYLENDLDHFEEDLDAVLDAYDKYLEEYENELDKKIEIRTKGEKIPDSENAGYLLVYDDKEREKEEEATEAEPVYYTLLYGYDAEFDAFCVEVVGSYCNKLFDWDTEQYVDADYSFEDHIAMLLSNYVRVEKDEVPQEEGVEGTLTVIEDLKFGNAIKLYDVDPHDSHRYRFLFFNKSDDGVMDDDFKEKYFIAVLDEIDYRDKDNMDVEVILRDYQYKGFYVSAYQRFSSPDIFIHTKPLFEMKLGDPIILVRQDEDITTELAEQLVDELVDLNVHYVYTDKYENQESASSAANISSAFTTDNVERYHTYEFPDGTKITAPIFKGHTELTIKDNGILTHQYFEFETDIAKSSAHIVLYPYNKNKEYIDEQIKDDFYTLVDECVINNRKCYIKCQETLDGYGYQAFIELEPDKYFILENFELEGPYFPKESHLEIVKGVLNLFTFE